MRLPRAHIFAIPLILLAACGSASTRPSIVATAATGSGSAAAKPSASVSAGATGQAAAKASGPTTFKIGDVIKAGDLQLTVTKVDAPFKSTNQFITPKNGQFLVASVSMQNTGSKSTSVSSMLSFELRDSDGQSYNGASTIVGLGWAALLLSVLGIIGGALALAHPKVAGIIMLIAGVGGFISVSLAYIVAGPLLIIGGLLAIAAKKPRPIAIAAS